MITKQQLKEIREMTTAALVVIKGHGMSDPKSDIIITLLDELDFMESAYDQCQDDFRGAHRDRMQMLEQRDFYKEWADKFARIYTFSMSKLPGRYKQAKADQGYYDQSAT